MKHSSLPFLGISFLFIWSIFLCFYHLGNPPLERWDEQTNREVVRELVQQRTFPFLNLAGKPFFEKPPLWYFLTAISVQTFGDNRFSYRLVSAASGFLIIVVTTLLAHRRNGTIGAFVAWLTLVTTTQLFAVNPGGFFSSHTFRSADGDTLMILWMILATTFFFLSNRRKKYYAFGIICSALGILSKGPIALIPLLVHGSILFHTRRLSLRFVITVAVLLLLILFPWYAVMSYRFGLSFWQQYAGYHIFARLTSPIEGHSESVLYYVYLLLNPRVFLLGLVFFVSLCVSINRWKNLTSETQELLVNILLILLTITLTQTKLAWYLLPVYPYAAMLIAGNIGITAGKNSTHIRTQRKITIHPKHRVS